MYKVFYKGEDAHQPAEETEEQALEKYLAYVEGATGESREEILGEDWTSPRGVEKCVKVKEVEE